MVLKIEFSPDELRFQSICIIYSIDISLGCYRKIQGAEGEKHIRKNEDNKGNDTTYLQKISVVDTEAPTFIVPDDVYLKSEESISPDSTGKPTNVYDNSGLNVDTIYNDEIFSENNLEKILKQ